MEIEDIEDIEDVEDVGNDGDDEDPGPRAEEDGSAVLSPPLITAQVAHALDSFEVAIPLAAPLSPPYPDIDIAEEF